MQTVAFAAGLLALAGLLAGAILIQSSDSGGDETTTVRATVRAGAPGAEIPPSFVGVSFEYFDMHALVGIPASGPNRAVAGLLAGLRSAGGPASLRAGGGSADATWWNPAHRPKPLGIAFDFDRPLMDGLRAFAALTHAPLVLTLNLAERDPAFADGVARAATRALPRGTLTAFELGNEPDFYPQRPLVTGNPARTRPAGYSWDDYLGEFSRVAASLPAGAPPAGPALSGPGPWTARLAQFLRREPRVREATLHGYPLSSCPDAHGTPQEATLGRLLGEDASAGFAGSFAPAIAAARAAGRPLRLSEIGSSSCGGTRGVSDAFGSALWSADTLFELARAGVSAVNFHGGNAKSLYTPFSTVYPGLHAVATARPMYYGMLLFARAAPAGARLLAVGAPHADGLKLWATRDPRGTVRAVAIAKRPEKSWQVRIRVPGAAGPATLERLSAPGAAATSHVKLAGQAVAPNSRDGRLRGRLRVERVVPAGGAYPVHLDGATAALLTVKTVQPS